MLWHVSLKLDHCRICGKVFSIFQKELSQPLFIIDFTFGKKRKFKEGKFGTKLIHDHAKLEALNMFPTVVGEMNVGTHFQGPLEGAKALKLSA